MKGARRNLNEITHFLTLQNKPPDLEWFPRLRCMSLNTEEVDQEQNEMKDLQRQLRDTTQLVRNLSSQLNELREKVNSVETCVHVCRGGCEREFKEDGNVRERERRERERERE